MAILLNITITNSGTDLGPYNIFFVNGSSVTTSGPTNISKALLQAGYIVSAPDDTVLVRVKSVNQPCLNYPLNLQVPGITTTTTTVAPGTTTTTSTTITPSTTTSTTSTTSTTTSSSTTTTTSTSTTTSTTTAAPLSNEWVVTNDAGITSGSGICLISTGGSTVYSDIPTFTGGMTFYTDIALTIPYNGQNWYHKIYHVSAGINYYGKIETAGTIAGLPDTSGSC